MRIEELMTRFPASVRPDAGVGRAAEVLAASESGPLMVVDGDGFVGTLAERDLMRALLPTTAEARLAGGTLTGAFDAFLPGVGERATRPVASLVVRDPVTVTPEDHLARAAVAMADRDLAALPVVAGGRLVGTISRSDVCRALLADDAVRSPTVAGGRGDV